MTGENEPEEANGPKGHADDEQGFHGKRDLGPIQIRFALIFHA